ncbi:MAG: glycoside hydrolase family 97 protein [Cytophagales bacterium]|nr:glycoside hydrolase family 97 protein [Cytophagales bacterium]
MKITYTIICFLLFNLVSGKEITLNSPDSKIEVVISIDENIRLKTYYLSKLLFKADNISLNIEGKDFGSGIRKTKNIKTNTVKAEIHPVIREKYKVIQEHYNEIRIVFKSEYTIVVRAYNEGMAYRFITDFAEKIIVNSEKLELNFNENDSAYFQQSESFNSSYETPYQHTSISDIATDKYCNLPFLVKNSTGVNVLVSESDLKDYPGLWLKSSNSLRLTSAHPGFPKQLKYDGSPYGHGQVKDHEEFIADVDGSRDFPWRIFAIAPTDSELLANTLIYQLASPCEIEDPSWIKPGVVTFDWWGRRGIYGTDFKSGVNTETAKYFIDFAAEFGFEYFLFDDGWSAKDDLFQVTPELDMEAVMAYAREKKVKIMLWVIWNTFEKQKEKAWDKFEQWGISGIKFDFMNRDDQKMVQFYYEVAKEAARRKMVIDFHGAYKPSGLRRSYPNVLTFEALIEFEYNGWTKHVTPRHDNILPYLRMVTGPMDYIPYTTHNAQKSNWRPVGDIPMGQGTRAHSMAQFVIYESPMQMLPDAPSDYYRERECTEFISGIPVEWDDLNVLHAKIGEYTVLSRRNGQDWYIGAITNWEKRSFEISLEFLDDGEYHLEFIRDGINADTRAIDYEKGSMSVTRSTNLTIYLAPGGGYVAQIIKKK